MNIDKLSINWQNFARVRLQLKFAFMIPHPMFDFVAMSPSKIGQKAVF